MKKELTFIFTIFIFLLSACGQSKQLIPTNDDLVIFAWEESWLPGAASNYVFSISSDEPDTEFESDNLETLYSYPEWSPNGKWILKITNDFRELSIIDTSSGREANVLIFPSKSELYDASWSPDSNRIVYTVLDHNDIEMRWIDVSCIQHGDWCKPEEHFLHNGIAPDWSPDGKLIAFAWNPNSKIPGQTRDSIFIMNSDGTGQPRKISGPLEDCRDPDWSPKNTRIVYSCDYDIYISNIDGSELVNLTTEPPDEPLDPWYPDDVQPSWNPDGDRIAFLSQRDTGGMYVGDLDAPRSNALYTVDPDGSNIKRVTLENHIAITWYAWNIPSKQK
jgi:Tol biopolymer transport system component